MKPKISFGAGVSWGALSQLEHRRMAKDQRHPLAYRVYFAAIGYANQIGHAEFGEGHLGVLLGKSGGPLSRQSVCDAISRAKAVDLVHLDSCTRCLVLASWRFQKEGLGTRSCGWHSLKGVRAA